MKNNVQNNQWKQWFAIGVIVIATIVVYYNSFKVPFLWDDRSKIVDNPDIKKLSNITTKLIYPSAANKTFERNDPSRPLVYLTFTLNYYIGKLNPFGYHLFNLIIHIFNVILIFFLTKKILSYTNLLNLSIYHSFIFSLFVSLLFAIHPVNTNSVTYLFSRSVLLATFFYLLSILFFIKTFEKNKTFYILSLLSFILALFARQDVVTLPAIILLFDYIILSDFSAKKVIENKYYHVPYWILFVGFLLFRYFYFGSIGDLEAENLPGRLIYLINQPYVIVKYLWLLFVPIGLSIDRGQFLIIKSIYELKEILSIIIIISIFIFAYQLYKRKSDTSKIILFSILWYFITLSPTSSFFPTTSTMVDNRLYLAGFGFYLILIFSYLSFFKSLKFPNFSIILICINILILGIITVKRNQLYQKSIPLWQDVVSYYPHSRAYNNLGVSYCEQKEYEKALNEYQKAICLSPKYKDAHYNLGFLFYIQKDYNNAIQHFKKVIELEPNYAKVHFELGNLYLDIKEYAKAIQEYQKVIEISPNEATVYNNLGVLYRILKDYNSAIQEYQKAIELNPDDEKAHNNLGVLYCNQKSYDKAIQEYQKALKINPNYFEAYCNLATAYCGLKRYDEALQGFEIALSLSPNDKDIQNKVNFLKQTVTH
ncbi:MAG: tetratricopeptide repeat protein [Elusimicrobia bacterium]|nr:tetratricopeptide repeat protein [Elusimicrobiota bacterium]